MGVKLRKKTNQDGTITPYLDIYHNGKRQYEFLPMLKLMAKPKSPVERQANKTNLAQAEQIQIKRAHELQASDYDMTPAFKRHVDFLAFFEAFVSKYKKRDKRVIVGCLEKFKKFMFETRIKTITAKQLTPAVVHDFKEYLKSNLNGETPANYFKKFKLCIKAAIRQGVIIKDPTEGQSIKAKTAIKKQVLTPEEIKLLAAAHSGNEQVKRASLFSLFTGLRFSDIINLKWSDIDFNNDRLNFTQQKTGEKVSMNLHESALKLLGDKGKPNGFVFSLPSHTGTSKVIRNWVKRAGINKHISFHCFRHSFATNIIFFGADVNTASSLLGHKSLRYTERYAHIVASLKEKAVNNLPSIEI